MTAGWLEPHGARAYDRWFDTAWGRYAVAVEARALLAAGSLGGVRALDVGCGTGRFTSALEAAGARVLGLDLDPGMLALARERLVGPLVLGDAHALPFRTGSFDLALAVTVLEFVAEPDRVMAELARVTRSGGRVVIGALNPRSPWGLAHRKSLERPPWVGARFLSRSDLLALGESQGRVSLRATLFAPGHFPGLGLVGPLLEIAGRVAPGFAAFQVLVISRR